jgi:hypothetical protein
VRERIRSNDELRTEETMKILKRTALALISRLLIGSAFVSDSQSCIMNHLVVGSAGVTLLTTIVIR